MAAEDSSSRKTSELGILNMLLCHANIIIHGKENLCLELATLNEFLEFFGMTRHKNFEDINGNVEIQDALRDLYDNPDLIELYPGLFCEGNGDWDAKTKTAAKNMELAVEQQDLKDLAETEKDLAEANEDPDQIRRIKKDKRPAKPPAPMDISNYSIIQNENLAKKELYGKPGVLHTRSSTEDTPKKSLMVQAGSLDNATMVLQEMVTRKQRLSLNYFVGMSREIYLRERRKFQGVTYQIDLVRGYVEMLNLPFDFSLICMHPFCDVLYRQATPSSTN
ncbi:MAG: hypothetical protein LQ347_005351 [Umbilicaria vellea]|nr:MAG: hypothetical protein LQ347_005351 [Umbilicaria vellea]